MRAALLILLVALCTSLPAREVRVTGEGAGQATLAKLQSQIEPGFDAIYNKTGIADDDAVHLHVISGSEAFARAAQADGVGMNAESVLGYAMPARRRIVLNLSGITERGLEPVGVLRHELAHLVMGSQLRVERPLWFEEGVAQYVEGVALNELREGGTPSLGTFSDLADLDAALRDDNRAGAAYLESREVIRLIVARHSEKEFFALMKRLERGEGPFAHAFEQATGEDLQAFEGAWIEDQNDRAGSRLARFVGGMFWWFVLGIGALAVPLIWLLRKKRGQSQVERWEEQEKYFPSDPEWSYADEPRDFMPPDPDAWRR